MRPSVALLDAAQEAAMVVMGARGSGGLNQLRVGSVSAQVAAHAACPVVVVRPDPVPVTHRVVVGIDGSPLSDAALAFAFEIAAERDCPLLALHAWAEPIGFNNGKLMIPFTYDIKAVSEDEERLAAEAVAGWREKYPDADFRTQVVHATAPHALATAGAQADLLVVGSRGHGGFTGLLLGSVSQTVLRHAPCTVAIVR